MKYLNEGNVLIPGTGYLVLVRHGQSMGNAWNAAYRNPEMNFLTEYGETQAKLAGLKLRETGIEFQNMITSGITRARHTLSILAHTMGDWKREFIVDARFNERIAPGKEHGPNEREALPHEHATRVMDGFSELVLPMLERNENVLLVSHYYTMQVLFKNIGVNKDTLWGHGEHIPNAVPFIWDRDQPHKMIVLNDETRVPKY